MENKNHKLSFLITNTIKDIPRADWDRLFGEGLIEGYGYHQTLEESNLKEFSFHFLLGRRQDKLIAIIPFFTTDFSFTTIIQGKLQKLIFFIQKWFRRFLKTRMLFVGYPTCEQLYIGISQEENLNEILGRALENLYKFSEGEKISTILFFNLTRDHHPIAEYLCGQGFVRMDNFPNTVIKINTASVQEYLKSLSKNTRKNIRRKLKKSSLQAELKTEVLEDIDSIKNRIYELYLNNFTYSDVHFEKLTPEFFQNICRNMKGVGKFFISRDKDKIVAFNLVLVKGQTAIDKFIGFDKELSGKYNLYYTTFINNIDYCIKNGYCLYQMGITDYEPKLRLGANLVPLYNCVKLLNPALNIFSPLVVKLIEPKRFDPTLKKIKH